MHSNERWANVPALYIKTQLHLELELPLHHFTIAYKDENFPSPVARLGGRLLWDLDQVQEFIKTIEIRPKSEVLRAEVYARLKNGESAEHIQQDLGKGHVFVENVIEQIKDEDRKKLIKANRSSSLARSLQILNRSLTGKI